MRQSLSASLASVTRQMMWIAAAFGAPIDPRWPVPERPAHSRPRRVSLRRTRNVPAAGGRDRCLPSPESTISASA